MQVWAHLRPFSSPTYQNAGDALLCPWFKCRPLSKSSEMCNGLWGLKWAQTCITWDCEVWCVVPGKTVYRRRTDNTMAKRKRTNNDHL
jgi:hypothetical protein